MNNDLEKFSEERLKKLIISAEGVTFPTFFELQANDTAALARIALAAKQAKPVEVLQFIINNPEKDGYIEWADCNQDYFNSISIDHRRVLYTTPQPAHTEQDGWIKCSERMPDSKNDVQLFCSDTREQFVGFHRGNGMFQFFNMNDVIGECEPTHWMPLTAAPKPETE